MNTHCNRCGRSFVAAGLAAGYGAYSEGDGERRYCYPCCAEIELATMRETGRATLYLTLEVREERYPMGVGRGRVTHAVSLTNWPGSLHIPLHAVTVGDHNRVGARYDVWFPLDGRQWHGTQYGRNTQLCHCRRTKQLATRANTYQIRGGAGYDTDEARTAS
jgi:hypothetical protein